MSDSFIASSPVLTASFSLARRLTAAQVAALGAVQTGTFDIATLPPNTLVKSIVCIANGQAAGVTTLPIAIGFTPTGYTDYLNGNDLISLAAGATCAFKADLAAGPTIPCAEIPSVTGATDIKAVVTASTGAETLDAVTGLDLSIYFECAVLPS